MADRITQLQQAIHLLADHFCNSIGLLQELAESTDTVDDSNSPLVYSRCISRTSYDISTIIESLPSVELKPDNHFDRLQLKIDNNDDRAKQLNKFLHIAKVSLFQIRNAQSRISDLQLKMLTEM